jgi:hypothetical protein
MKHLLGSPRFAMQKTLLQLPGAEPQDYGEQIDDILALLGGTYRSPEGAEAHVVPGEGAGVQVWILGGSGGQSAQAAGANGLRFAANYHVSPATVLEAADGYRAAFRPSADLGRPYVSVSGVPDAGAGPGPSVDRRRRALRHHHYARPRRPDPVLPAAGRGMAPPVRPAAGGPPRRG